ncbi:MAG TPA: hypothetical protein VKB73_10115 [Gaiellaceae bacterium]|nr:hypothetical protein [Gaiellaceae bacterium]
MRQLVAGVALGAVLASGALIIARVLEPGRRELELDIYVLTVGAIALLAGILVTRRAFPLEDRSSLAEALDRDERPSVRPPDLERTERLVSMASTTAFDLHFRLRPVLREVVEQRLAERRGLRLDSGDPRVQEACGAELWEVVRPDREPPDNRYRPGLEREAFERVVARLEEIR